MQVTGPNVQEQLTNISWAASVRLVAAEERRCDKLASIVELLVGVSGILAS